MKSYIIYTNDGRDFRVEAYSRAHAERQVIQATNGRCTISIVKEVR